MKKKLKELDVDFIGGQSKSLTKEEELAISSFFKKLKEGRRKTNKLKPVKREKKLFG